MEGKSLDSRDGCLKQDKKKEEENFEQEQLEGLYSPCCYIWH